MTTYLVRGIIIWGGDAPETVTLAREVGPGDRFEANLSWFEVKQAGLRDTPKDGEPSHVLDAVQID